MQFEDDLQKVDEYLKEIEPYFEHISLVKRNDIIAEIRDEIIRAQNNSGQSLETIFDSLGTKLDVVNRYLIQHGLPKAKNVKKRNVFKLIFAAFVAMIVIGIIAILILVKSITPIFEFNEEDKSLTVFGEKVTIFSDSMSFSKVSKNNSKYDISGEHPLKGVKQVVLLAENIDFKLVNQNKNTLHYSCEANFVNNNVVSKSGEKIQLNFEGPTKCYIRIPSDVAIKGVFDEGFLSIEVSDQDLDFKLGNGKIKWFLNNTGQYSLNARIRNGTIIGDVDDFRENAKYKASIILNNGNLEVKGL